MGLPSKTCPKHVQRRDRRAARFDASRVRSRAWFDALIIPFVRHRKKRQITLIRLVLPSPAHHLTIIAANQFLQQPTMASTPKRAVRWGVDAQHQLSPMDSPQFDGTYDGDTSGASSAWTGANLEFLNAQLVAHGFVPSPGLSLDGLDGAESTRVMKCFLALLNQRMVSNSPFLLNIRAARVVANV